MTSWSDDDAGRLEAVMTVRPARLAEVAGFSIDKVAAAAGDDPDVLRLENLDTDAPPPREAVEATKAAVGELTANSYLPFTGRRDLRLAVADRVRSRSGVEYDPDSEVVITASDGDGLLDALLAVTDPQDEVIITDPTYAGILNRILLAGARPRVVPMRAVEGAWRLDLEELAASVGPATRAIMLQNPSFPSGYLLTDAEWREIARLCVEHDLWLIYWALMEGIVFDDGAVIHPASYPGMRERTIVVGTVSLEQRMIGWRIGWMVAPEAVMSDLSVVHMYNGVVAGGIAQAGALAALTADDDGLAGCLAEWQRRRDTVCDQLRGLPMLAAAGGWSQILDSRALGVEPGALSHALLRHRVAATPMTGWGGPVADRQLRLVFIREPVPRLEQLGDRFASALVDLEVTSWRTR
jgi:aspartate/methionine/tyrosine aminotransferase